MGESSFQSLVSSLNDHPLYLTSYVLADRSASLSRRASMIKPSFAVNQPFPEEDIYLPCLLLLIDFFRKKRTDLGSWGVSIDWTQYWLLVSNHSLPRRFVEILILHKDWLSTCEAESSWSLSGVDSASLIAAHTDRRSRIHTCALKWIQINWIRTRLAPLPAYLPETAHRVYSPRSSHAFSSLGRFPFSLLSILSSTSHSFHPRRSRSSSANSHSALVCDPASLTWSHSSTFSPFLNQIETCVC